MLLLLNPRPDRKHQPKDDGESKEYDKDIEHVGYAKVGNLGEMQKTSYRERISS
jgi:hypothetical protein